MSTSELLATIKTMAVAGKGILAADESTPTIAKRLKTINLESTEANRQAYREILFTTPSLGAHINGVILFDETLRQSTQDGVPFAKTLSDQGIVPGIKVDKGVVTLPGSPDEKITQGLDGLGERLQEYKALGARFAKWRAVIVMNDTLPTMYAIKANAQTLARYAAICQAEGIVPIVEPEVLMDGAHTIERCKEVTEKVLKEVFQALKEQQVNLKGIILKPNMVVAGLDCPTQPSAADVAKATLDVFVKHIPADVPMVNFLSGGQSDVEATANLNEMNKTKNLPWLLSFSYGRALQAPVLQAWGGKPENVEAAKQAMHKRAELNGKAVLGEYTADMETTVTA